MSKPTLEVKDFTKEFNEVISKFKNDSVLVGIPEDETDREDGETAGINNATLLAINNFGSPINNIPARPVMEIGIRAAQDDIAAQYKIAAIKALTQGPKALSQYYNRVGIIASTSIKKVINEQIDIDPPSAGTLRTRKSRGFKGTKSLIVTGQLRNAITYVVPGEE